MKRSIYKLTFPSGVHFGIRNLTETESFFCADILFSALCQEALQHGQEMLRKFYESANGGQIKFSDGLPYIGENLYIPKPFLQLNRANAEFDSKGKKVMKKLRFIPITQIDALLQNTLQAEVYAEEIKKLGKAEEKTSVFLSDQKEAMPWRAGIYRFYEGSGLYLCVQFAGDEEEDLFEQLLSDVSYVGIGGERSSGYGRFTYKKETVQEELEKRFSGEYKRYMTLSVCLPNKAEMDQITEEASFQLKKRSGFVNSDTAGENGIRKKDLYVFAAGSCFTKRFEGNIFNVSRTGIHPVYRYAKALMIGV